MRDGENGKAYDLRRSGEERELCGKIVTKKFHSKRTTRKCKFMASPQFPNQSETTGL